MKLAVSYGKGAETKHMKLGEGLVGWAALHKEPVLVADVSTDPRYVNLVDDARSELVIPMLIKDRCIGVFDLESPELNAFTKEHKELLTLLASQAAIAIDNATCMKKSGGTRSGSKRSCALPSASRWRSSPRSCRRA